MRRFHDWLIVIGLFFGIIGLLIHLCDCSADPGTVPINCSRDACYHACRPKSDVEAYHCYWDCYERCL